MKRIVLTAFCIAAFLLHLQAQKVDKLIKVKNVRKVETKLAADDMQGRAVFTAGIEKAAAFIAAEFKKAKLKPLETGSYFQEFELVAPRQESAVGSINGETVEEKDIVAITTREKLAINDQSGFKTASIKAEDNLFRTAYSFIRSSENTIVWVNKAHAGSFENLHRFKRETFEKETSVLFILTDTTPATYSFEVHHNIVHKKLKNVVGILPGKSKKDEYVIFSGHYDHLGIGKPNEQGDSIFNGANDDAAGITAVISLANYFRRIKDNERTIIFAAFTAEETGGYGSQYFSQQFNPDKVVAMFNIEMIGTDSKWGKNSAYITGYEKSDMGQILERNLQATGFKFYPDPYPDQQLFYRSDNATLAMLGVPAHTISTSKMDSEPYYHTQDDEVETLDLENMTEIIKAIALSARSIVAGLDTPTRVNTSQLR
ncbi:MAG: M20/M25/M40 family metallo-hydrolase [Chitinophagaceae bacterium]|nr:M20/M25/M40 family metallo-hydrolase [Chitinophagaceae bacterium]MCW5929625.1 M20/M25/M40 family metallo-hydrolase [Chitinophagaceae bacterium]